MSLELSQNSREVEWFYDRPGDIPPEFLDLLATYSGIPAQDAENHITSIVRTLSFYC